MHQMQREDPSRAVRQTADTGNEQLQLWPILAALLSALCIAEIATEKFKSKTWRSTQIPHSKHLLTYKETPEKCPHMTIYVWGIIIFSNVPALRHALLKVRGHIICERK